MPEKILLVDDDVQIIASYQRILSPNYQVEVALNAAQALDTMTRLGPFPVIVSDYQMAGMDGLQFLAEARKRAPSTVRIMLTGHADLQVAIEALNNGAVFQFLTKPCPEEMLRRAIEAGVKQYHLIHSEKDLLEKTLNGTIKALTEILAMVDRDVFGRCEKMREEARAIAQYLKLEDAWVVELAAMLSSLGSVTVPASLLRRSLKGEYLVAEEEAIVRKIPDVGAQVITHIPRLDPVAKAVLYQHKNYDGSGHPADNVSRENIPIAARILRILHELIKQEEKGVPRFAALEKMLQYRENFDPKLVDEVFLCFKAAASTTAGAPAAAGAQPKTLKDLRPGMTLASDLMTKDGMLILPIGSKLNLIMLKKVYNFAEISGVKEPVMII